MLTQSMMTHPLLRPVVMGKVGKVGVGRQQQQRFFTTVWRRTYNNNHSVVVPRTTSTGTSWRQQQQQEQSSSSPLQHGATFIMRGGNITSITKRWHGGPTVPDDSPTVSIIFLQPDGVTQTKVDGKVGESLLQITKRYDSIELEGACEGVCACSTCHVILSDSNIFDTLEEPSEDEEDMLDMAFGLTETSRLGCQVLVTKEMNNMVVELPKATRNFYVDGHVPQGH